MKNAIFVDLSNFYGSCLKSGIVDEQTMRGYFVEWIDFDRLAYYLTGEWCPVWVFYSKDRVGPSNSRIDKTFLTSMIERMNRQRGVTARDVNIPGEQREKYEFNCEKCNATNVTESIGEKGVDASLTVHLFETMNTWDTAYLLSGDADFVPVVSSLRRLGKNIITVSSQNTSPALIRESYDTRNLDYEFLKEDLLVYSLFMENGFIEKWLSKPEENTSNLNDVFVTIDHLNEDYFLPVYDIAYYLGTGSNKIFDQNFRLRFETSMPIDNVEKEKRMKLISDFFQNPDFVENFSLSQYFKIYLLPLSFQGLARHLQEFISRNPHIKKDSNGYLTVSYK